MTRVAGTVVPSTSSLALTIVAVHVLFGLASVIYGVMAMLSPKCRARHSKLGTICFWCLSPSVVLASGLIAITLGESWPLLSLGILSFLAALTGRTARRNTGEAGFAGSSSEWVHRMSCY